MSQSAGAAQPQRITYREACKQAIRDAILADPRVFLMGEDVGRYGGCYAVSKGLLDEFGPRTASATRRCPKAASSAPASARRSPACGRSSRS